MGQNFLVETGAIKKLAGAAELTPDDTVLEIGPGTGNLTSELVARAKKVVAVEFDRRLVTVLREKFHASVNLTVINEDIRDFNELKLEPGYKIVANLPFYITAPAIRKFLESRNPPKSLTLIVQKEVAQRITAGPGAMSILAISVQFYAGAKIVATVSKGCFWPIPGVDSAILKIAPWLTQPNRDFAAVFFSIVKAGFSQPRKQMINNLSKKLVPTLSREAAEKWLADCGIDPARRAETLSMEEWQKLAETYAKNRG